MTGVVLRVSRCTKFFPTPIPLKHPILRASCTMFMRSKPLDTAMSQAMPWHCVCRVAPYATQRDGLHLSSQRLCGTESHISLGAYLISSRNSDVHVVPACPCMGAIEFFESEILHFFFFLAFDSAIAIACFSG